MSLKTTILATEQVLPSYHSACAILAAACTAQGYSGEPIWIFGEDLAHFGSRIFLRPPASEEIMHIVKTYYEYALETSRRVTVRVIGSHQQRPIAFIWIPRDALDDLFAAIDMSGARFGVWVDSVQNLATIIQSPILLAWLRTLNRIVFGRKSMGQRPYRRVDVPRIMATDKPIPK